MTPQQGVSTIWWGKKESRGWVIAFPHIADVIWKGVLHPPKNGVGSKWEELSAKSWPYSFLSRATSPSLSSQVSSPLCPPSNRVQGEWLRMGFSALALYEDACLSSRLLSLLVDRIPTNFHSHMLYGHLFPTLVLWAGEPSMGLRPHGNLCLCNIPPESQSSPFEAGPALFASTLSYQSWQYFFSKPLVIRLLFS